MKTTEYFSMGWITDPQNLDFHSVPRAYHWLLCISSEAISLRFDNISFIKSKSSNWRKTLIIVSAGHLNSEVVLRDFERNSSSIQEYKARHEISL